MFADVQETYLGGGRDFEQQIRRAASEALGSRYSLPSVRSTSSTSQGSSASNTTSYVGSSSNQGSSAAARTRDTSPNISFQDAGGRTSGLFVLLCVNGPQIAQLGQISVSRGQNDQILFQNIRASYKELRHRFKRNFHPDTPELLQTIVLWGDRLWNQSQKQAISIFSYLRLNWLVWWIGDSVFYVPQSANFVRVSQRIYYGRACFANPCTAVRVDTSQNGCRSRDPRIAVSSSRDRGSKAEVPLFALFCRHTQSSSPLSLPA